MTWRWRTYSRIAARFAVRAGALALLLAPLSLPAAQLRGQVELTNSKDPEVSRNRDYAGVVIWLEPVGRPAPPPPPRHVEMKQQDKTFKPHVVAVPLGGTVEFPNLDPFFHNAFSNFAGQPFDLRCMLREPPAASPSGVPGSCGYSARSMR